MGANVVWLLLIEYFSDKNILIMAATALWLIVESAL